MPSPSTALPSLAFADDIAVTHDSAPSFGALIERLFPGLSAYDPAGNAASFRSRTAVLTMKSSSIVATAVSPTIVDRTGNERLTFMMPIAGDSLCTCQVGANRIEWGTKRGGVFMPQTSERVIGTGGFRSQIMWHMDPSQLGRVAMSMVGSHKPVELHLDHARLLPATVMAASTEATFHAIAPLLQLHRHNPAALSRLGVEDYLYRVAVTLLRPDLFADERAQDPSLGKTRNSKLLDTVVEYMAARLAEPVTLSELESMSGLSARSLQLSFNARFGCSPMAWLKEQRLSMVRRALLQRVGTPLSALAFSAGFQTMPTFFAAYKKRFGETPGQTREATKGLTRGSARY